MWLQGSELEGSTCLDTVPHSNLLLLSARRCEQNDRRKNENVTGPNIPKKSKKSNYRLLYAYYSRDYESSTDFERTITQEYKSHAAWSS
jgi:hypothetical protein